MATLDDMVASVEEEVEEGGERNLSVEGDKFPVFPRAVNSRINKKGIRTCLSFLLIYDRASALFLLPLHPLFADFLQRTLTYLPVYRRSQVRVSTNPLNNSFRGRRRGISSLASQDGDDALRKGLTSRLRETE